MAAATVQRLDIIDKISINLVFEFIRQCEYEYFGDIRLQNAYYNIPMLVNHLCLFYYYICECFTVHGSAITLNNQCNTATITSDFDSTDQILWGEWQTVYGSIDIKVGSFSIYKWWFKILELDTKSDDIHIGIDSSNKTQLEVGFYSRDNKYHNYAYRSNGDLYKMQDQVACSGLSTGYQCDDIVTMQLDLRRKAIRFWVNEKDQGELFKNIKIKDIIYHLAVCLEGNSSIQLIKFERKP